MTMRVCRKCKNWGKRRRKLRGSCASRGQVARSDSLWGSPRIWRDHSGRHHESQSNVTFADIHFTRDQAVLPDANRSSFGRWRKDGKG
jgi:hypothetical protein